MNTAAFAHRHRRQMVERIREALAHDPNVAELGITVRVTPDMVFLTGDVGAAERKDAVAAAVEPLAEGRAVRNGITVVKGAEVDLEETIS